MRNVRGEAHDPVGNTAPGQTSPHDRHRRHSFRLQRRGEQGVRHGPHPSLHLEASPSPVRGRGEGQKMQRTPGTAGGDEGPPAGETDCHTRSSPAHLYILYPV